MTLVLMQSKFNLTIKVKNSYGNISDEDKWGNTLRIEISTYKYVFIVFNQRYSKT